MLKKLRLTDFKSFVDEEVELAPLTLLVGANASGKSNFLDAIRFLHGLSLDLQLPEVLNGEEQIRPDRWSGIRGRTEEASRFGQKAFTIGSFWDTSQSAEFPKSLADRGWLIRHQISCLGSSSPSRIDEWVEHGNERLTAGRLLPEDSMIAPSTFHFMHSLETDRFKILKALWKTIEAVRYLEIDPSAMREYGRRGTQLGNEGKNLSGVLAALCDTPSVKQSLVDWLREVCAPEIENLDFAEVKELGDVMAIFVEHGGVRISARSSSDGTLSFLGTLLALRTAKPGEIFLIEEIEEGLHPTRIRLLVEFIEAVVRERQIQVIATTHSPTVLQWLSPEILREVIAFGRVSDKEGTLMRRLGQLPHFDEVVQRKGIEELFSTGWLEMAL
jgi:predicted ATPase